MYSLPPLKYCKVPADADGAPGRAPSDAERFYGRIPAEADRFNGRVPADGDGTYPGVPADADETYFSFPTDDDRVYGRVPTDADRFHGRDPAATAEHQGQAPPTADEFPDQAAPAAATDADEFPSCRSSTSHYVPTAELIARIATALGIRLYDKENDHGRERLVDLEMISAMNEDLLQVAIENIKDAHYQLAQHCYSPAALPPTQYSREELYAHNKSIHDCLKLTYTTNERLRAELRKVQRDNGAKVEVGELLEKLQDADEWMGIKYEGLEKGLQAVQEQRDQLLEQTKAQRQELQKMDKQMKLKDSALAALATDMVEQRKMLDFMNREKNILCAEFDERIRQIEAECEAKWAIAIKACHDPSVKNGCTVHELAKSVESLGCPSRPGQEHPAQRPESAQARLGAGTVPVSDPQALKSRIKTPEEIAPGISDSEVRLRDEVRLALERNEGLTREEYRITVKLLKENEKLRKNSSMLRNAVVKLKANIAAIRRRQELDDEGLVELPESHEILCQDCLDDCGCEYDEDDEDGDEDDDDDYDDSDDDDDDGDDEDGGDELVVLENLCIQCD
ncbi:hypothetical protein BZA05DRAFT_468326 [Tricharina praecox]|uniref:uncharacterized protein n=1 Tax=Tricharina praecox TaxID=43433 RepID=UPI00221EB6A8|nr:uncharacterized protein BZA05DRAFT_468326 [Tricharina praecox]KAI5853774.1 hypothetical protein BZA05DRAFT_468326 [Tricharina praecox]